MKMEFVEKELKSWGEIIITTSGGQKFEIHWATRSSTTTNRVIRLKSANALYVIEGDSVESITKHYGHPDD